MFSVHWYQCDEIQIVSYEFKYNLPWSMTLAFLVIELFISWRDVIKSKRNPLNFKMFTQKSHKTQMVSHRTMESHYDQINFLRLLAWLGWSVTKETTRRRRIVWALNKYGRCGVRMWSRHDETRASLAFMKCYADRMNVQCYIAGIRRIERFIANASPPDFSNRNNKR